MSVSALQIVVSSQPEENVVLVPANEHVRACRTVDTILATAPNRVLEADDCIGSDFSADCALCRVSVMHHAIQIDNRGSSA